MTTAVSPFDIADFKKDRGCIRTENHREAVAEIPDPNRIAVRVRIPSSPRPCFRADAAMIGSSITSTS
jgi:hypothetical protein